MNGFNVLNIGFQELLFILILAGLVMGPQRIRVVARWLGQTTAKLRGISTQFMAQLNSELDGSEREDLKGALDDIRSLQKELRDLRREVYSGPKKAFDDEKRRFDKNNGQSNGTAVAASANNTSENNIAGASVSLPSVVDIDDDPE